MFGLDQLLDRFFGVGQEVLRESTDLKQNLIDLLLTVPLVRVDRIRHLPTLVLFGDKKRGGLFEMIHILFFNPFEIALLVNVIKIWFSEHAEEEIKMHHGNRNVRS